MLRLSKQATKVVESAVRAGDVKASLAVLKGQGFLKGEGVRIGSEKPEELRVSSILSGF